MEAHLISFVSDQPVISTGIIFGQRRIDAPFTPPVHSAVSQTPSTTAVASFQSLTLKPGRWKQDQKQKKTGEAVLHYSKT